MAVCPIYEVMQHEGAVARGKIGLARSLSAEAKVKDSDLNKYLGACLLCNRCKMSCPNQVDTASIVQHARYTLLSQKGQALLKRFFLRRLLPSPGLMNGLFSAGRATRPLWARRIRSDSGLHLRFMKGKSKQRHRIPPIASSSFLRQVEQTQDAESSSKDVSGSIALFVGCINNYLRPQAAQAALDVFSGLGRHVVVPTQQVCCGLPAFSMGDDQAAFKLVQKNLDAFVPEGADPVPMVTSPCASCAYMLRFKLPEIAARLGDERLQRRAQLLASRVLPFSNALGRVLNRTQEGPGRRQSRPKHLVTFHDPCHLSRGFGEKDAPRAVLTWLADVGLVEMCHPCRCCGHGGSFSLVHYDLSTTMGADKARRIADSKAAWVVTECSGCVLQLQEVLLRCDVSCQVLTTAEAVCRFGWHHDSVLPGL